jgi:hypothetical protein
MDADGDNQTRITTHAANDVDPVFSPDGQQIVFGSTRGFGDLEIYVMGADGSNPTNLTGNTAIDGAADWGVRDAVAPGTQISQKPANPTASRRATFKFKGTDLATPPGKFRFSCKLDSSPFRSCGSPKTYTGLKPGRHTLKVRATDASGNLDPTPATYTWRITRG